MKNSVLCLIFIMACITSCYRPISKEILNQHLMEIDSLKRFAGFGVAVFNKDSVYFTKGYGKSDINDQIPYTSQSSQIIASVSKMFIGFSLLKCQELGYLKITDPVNKHLPIHLQNPYFPETVIRLDHLATHSASFKYSEKMSDSYNYSFADSSLFFLVKNYLTPEGLWYAKENFHRTKPGEIWDYSNTGSVVAAAVVEQVSGLSYEVFLEKYLFKPLEMETSHRFQENMERSLHYELDSSYTFEEIPRKKMGLYPAGNYVSSVLDMVKFVQMLMNKGSLNGKEVLTPKSIEQMLAGYIANGIEKIDPEGYDSGIFCFHDKNILGNPQRVKGHLGGDTGIFTSVWFEPKSGLGYIFFSNTGRSDQNLNTTIYVWQQLYRYRKGIRK